MVQPQAEMGFDDIFDFAGITQPDVPLGMPDDRMSSDPTMKKVFGVDFGNWGDLSSLQNVTTQLGPGGGRRTGFPEVIAHANCTNISA